MPTANQRMLPFPPLGISVLAASLKKAGFEVRIRDLEMMYWDRDLFRNRFLKKLARALPLKYNNPKKIFLDLRKVYDYLDSGRPDAAMEIILNEWEGCSNIDLSRFEYIGFSVMGMEQLSTSLCFAKFLKQRYGVKIIFGGSLISEKTSVLLEKYSFLDYFIVGEGEIPLSLLLRQEEEKDIPNLIFRKGGLVTVNKTAALYSENMEPDFEGLPFDLYRRNKVLLVPYETSKGCINKCNFCITRRKELRFKEVGKIIEDLRRIRDTYGTRCFLFVDNAINLSHDFSRDLCNELIKNKLDILWSAYCIPKKEDGDYFELLRKSGCVQLRWGIESFSGDVLREMNKRIEKREVSDLLSSSHSAGIWNHVIFIFGHPLEKMGDIFEVIHFISGHKKFIRSAVLARFELERLDIFSETGNYYQDNYPNGKCRQMEKFGIKYRIFEDRHLALKYGLLLRSFRFNGIRFIGNFNKMKGNFEENQFMFNVFNSYLAKERTIQ